MVPLQQHKNKSTHCMTAHKQSNTALTRRHVNTSLHKHRVTSEDQHGLTQPVTSELYPKLPTCSRDRLIGVKVGQLSSLTESSTN